MLNNTMRSGDTTQLNTVFSTTLLSIKWISSIILYRTCYTAGVFQI